jgi:hypothetical protein
MGDLVVFAALVGVFGAAGIALGILAARRLGPWDERRATAGAGAVRAADTTGAVRRTGSTPGNEPPEDGGETVD